MQYYLYIHNFDLRSFSYKKNSPHFSASRVTQIHTNMKKLVSDTPTQIQIKHITGGWGGRKRRMPSSIINIGGQSGLDRISFFLRSHAVITNPSDRVEMNGDFFSSRSAHSVDRNVNQGMHPQGRAKHLNVDCNSTPIYFLTPLNPSASSGQIRGLRGSPISPRYQPCVLVSRMGSEHSCAHARHL